jgi:hypothetical protein
VTRQNRSNIALGVILVLVGIYFLGQKFFPDFVLFKTFEWPMIIIGVGGLLLLIGLLTGQPGMAVPAAIVAGIGGILYYQNATGNWESWSYAWALIPGFVGVGSVIAGILGDNPRQSFRHGLNLILFSAVLFAIFFTIFNGGQWAAFWPVLLIALGGWLLIRAILRR